MSLLSKIGRAVGKIARKAAPFIPGIGGIVAGAAGAVLAKQRTAGLGMLPALPAIGGAVVRALPGVGRAVGRVAGRVVRSPIARGAAAGVAGAAIYDAAGNLIGFSGPRRRRINPLNIRAARRAVRRIKGVRKICRQIESSLPRRPAAKSRGWCPPTRRK